MTLRHHRPCCVPPPPPNAILQASAGRVLPQVEGHGWDPRPPPRAPRHSTVHGVEVVCDTGVWPTPDSPRGRYKSRWGQVGAGREDRATQPPPRNGMGENDPRFSRYAILLLRSDVHMSLGSHRARHAASLPRGALDPCKSPDTPCGEVTLPQRACLQTPDASNLWESQDLPWLGSPLRCARPLPGVVADSDQGCKPDRTTTTQRWCSSAVEA